MATKHKTINATLTYDAITLGELMTFKLDGVERATKKLNLISDQWATYIGTTSEPGTIQVTGYYDWQASSSDVNTLTSMLSDTTGQAYAWVIVFDTHQTIHGSGILTKFEVSEFKNDELSTYSATIKNTGEITYTTTGS